MTAAVYGQGATVDGGEYGGGCGNGDVNGGCATGGDGGNGFEAGRCRLLR